MVSHSAALAEAAVGLAAGLLPGHGVRVRPAAGADGGFGTDATAVATAIEAVDSGAGVLVLCDLGSAVLSAELALEFLDHDLALRVRLSAAPLVEGLVAAVAAASGGADLAAVADAADSALAPKHAHLAADSPATPNAPGGPGQDVAIHPDESVAPDPDESVEATFRLGTTDGLHARPAARLAAEVGAADVEAWVTNLRTGGPPADAASMLELMTLDARQGDRVQLVAAGPDAAAVVGAALLWLTGEDA